MRAALLGALAVALAVAPPAAFVATIATPSAADARSTRSSKRAQARAQARALASFRAGVAHYQGGRFKQAAARFRAAFELDDRAVYLFNAARATQRGGDRDRAAQDYQRVVALPGAPAKVVARCQTLLAEIRDARRREAAIALKTREQERARQVAAEQQRIARANAWRRPAGWSGVVVGAALLGVGGWLLIGVLDEQATLDKKLAQRNVDGRVVGIDATTYNAEQDRLDRNLGMSGALLGVGAVAAGVGAWWLSHTPSGSRVALLPRLDGRGARMIVRF